MRFEGIFQLILVYDVSFIEQKRGPQRSVEIIVSAAFLLAIILVSILCIEVRFCSLCSIMCCIKRECEEDTVLFDLLLLLSILIGIIRMLRIQKCICYQVERCVKDVKCLRYRKVVMGGQLYYIVLIHHRMYELFLVCNYTP
jgi:hypothetical protein